MKNANRFLSIILIAFTSLSGGVKKKALVEYVGSTQCPVCPQVTVLLDRYQDPSHADYFGKDIVDDMVVVRYHTYNPGYGDPMYATIGGKTCDTDFTCVRINGEENVEWYDISGVPSVFIDGEKTNSYLADVQATQAETTPVTISLNGSSFDDLTVNIKVTVSSDTDLSAEPLYLFVMATIDSVHYAGYNGETEHEQVFLGFIGDTGPGGLGKALTLNKDQAVEWTDTWTMQSDYPNEAHGRDLGTISDWNTTVWDKKNMNLVAFVQHKTTLEVVQVEMISRRNYEFLSTEGEGVPVEFALHENYPNPFNPTTTLRFDLPEVSNLTLTIYNMLGQKVRTFNYQNTSAGYHSITWDATNDFGQQVGAGVYLYQLQTKDFVQTRKMVLLK